MLLKITARGLLVVIISFLNFHTSFASSTSDDQKESLDQNTLHQKIYTLSAANPKTFTQGILTTFFAEAESKQMECLDPGKPSPSENTVTSPFINDPSFLAVQKPKIRIDDKPLVLTSLSFDSVPEDNTQMGNPPTWRYALGDIIQFWEDWSFKLVRASKPNPEIDVVVPFCVHLALQNALDKGDNIGWMLKIYTEPLENADQYQRADDHSKNLTELFVRFGLFQEKKYIPEPLEEASPAVGEQATSKPDEGTAQPEATSSTTTNS